MSVDKVPKEEHTAVGASGGRCGRGGRGGCGGRGSIAASSSTELVEAVQELTVVSSSSEEVTPGATSKPALAPGEASADNFCTVCWVEPRTHLVFPCGHKCLCEGCTATIGEHCPMCQGPKVGVCRVVA